MKDWGSYQGERRSFADTSLGGARADIGEESSRGGKEDRSDKGKSKMLERRKKKESIRKLSTKGS